MRGAAVLLLLVLIAGSYSCGRTTRIASLTPTASAQPLQPTKSSSPRIDFGTQVKPILEAKCQGCHFRGGKMYDKLPFDRPETIKTLGTKLFTRIHDENERKVIREFLAQE